MDPIILAARNIDYVYPGKVQALQGLSLDIAKGRKLAILGPNGSGKTTLLLHLNGTLRPRRGEILLDGRPAAYDRRSLNSWRSRVGLVLQEPEDQLFSASVYQDISFGPLNQGLSALEARERVREALVALQIEGLAERATHMLSFGQKKRVAIAGILAMRPEVLILDEPTAGLDAQGVAQLLTVLEEQRRAGTTLVFATHDVDLAYTWADGVAVFCDGQVLAQGETVAILSDRKLLQAARLEMPWLLEVAQALGAKESPPRSQQALLDLLRLSDSQPSHERTYPRRHPFR
ncbi:MAG: ATP-binding cassette domain-containing protein [Candidatus Competibacteraceae bacterium]